MTYSVNDVADRLGVSERTVLAWIAEKSLRAINVSRKAGAKRPTWRITERALADFEAARTTLPAAPPTIRRRRQADPEIIEFIK
jgi:excisionase family DNA binding protein